MLQINTLGVYLLALFLSLSAAFQLPENVLLGRRQLAPLLTGTPSDISIPPISIPSSSTGGPTSNPPTSSNPPSTSPPPTSSPPSSTPAPSTTPPSSSVSSSASASITSSDSSSSPSTTGGVSISSSSNLVIISSDGHLTTIDRSSISSSLIITSPLVSSATRSFVTTIVGVSGSSTFSSVFTTKGLVPTTIGSATSTISPSLQNGGSSGSGLSTPLKKIIGGVIGGVGGVLLLGVIGLVAWRLWGRQRHTPLSQEDDMLDSQNDSIRREKAFAQNPEDNPLDRYKNPGGSLNTASNF